MERDEILEIVRAILRTEFEVDERAVVPTARLREDLDLDSLDAVVLAARLENTTGLILQEERLKEIRTVQDVVDVIEDPSSANPGAL